MEYLKDSQILILYLFEQTEKKPTSTKRSPPISQLYDF